MRKLDIYEKDIEESDLLMQMTLTQIFREYISLYLKYRNLMKDLLFILIFFLNEYINQDINKHTLIGTNLS